jgi:ketosteroid isomerase-like protein
LLNQGTTALSVEDRVAILDVLAHYAWCMDRGDAKGVAALFAPDGLLRNAAGQEFHGQEGVEKFAAAAASQPGFRGRQHHIRHLFMQPAENGWRALSYYQVVTFAAGKEPEILSIGCYDDHCVKIEGRWRIKAKRLNRWNSTAAPQAGDVALAPSPVLAIPQVSGVSAADREEITDLMMAYASCLDRGDVPGMTAIFAPDGVVHSGALGDLKGAEGIRAFLTKAVSQPGFNGRQHRVRPVMFEIDGENCRAMAYWMVVTWDAGKEPRLVALGYYEDVFTRVNGAWKFKDKTIRRWSSESAPTLPGVT